MKPVIQMRNGEYFDFSEPNDAAYSIEDIAHALSHLCRYNGHTREFYSVAQHSVLVSALVPEEYALAALLHDASEFVLGDVTAPLKQLLPPYQRLERTVQASIYQHFGVPFEEVPPCVKEADLVALMTEKRDLMPDDDDSLAGLWPTHVQPVGPRIVPANSQAARAMFLHRYKEILTNG